MSKPLPFETWKSEILPNIPRKQSTRTMRSLTTQFRERSKEDAIYDLVSKPFTEQEIDDYVNSNIYYVGIYKSGFNHISSSLYMCLLHFTPRKLLKITTSKDDIYKSIFYSEMTDFDNLNIKYLERGISLSKILRNIHEFGYEYDLLTTYNILMYRAQQYFLDITTDDIKKYLLKVLDEKYSLINDTEQYTLELIGLRGYLVINCIIMGIQYGDITDFLKPIVRGEGRNGKYLENKDIDIITHLYDVVRQGIVGL